MQLSAVWSLIPVLPIGLHKSFKKLLRAWSLRLFSMSKSWEFCSWKRSYNLLGDRFFWKLLIFIYWTKTRQYFAKAFRSLKHGRTKSLLPKVLIIINVPNLHNFFRYILILDSSNYAAERSYRFVIQRVILDLLADLLCRFLVSAVVSIALAVTDWWNIYAVSLTHIYLFTVFISFYLIHCSVRITSDTLKHRIIH